MLMAAPIVSVSLSSAAAGAIIAPVASNAAVSPKNFILSSLIMANLLVVVLSLISACLSNYRDQRRCVLRQAQDEEQFPATKTLPYPELVEGRTAVMQSMNVPFYTHHPTLPAPPRACCRYRPR